MIRLESNPYDKRWLEYLENRKKNSISNFIAIYE